MRKRFLLLSLFLAVPLLATGKPQYAEISNFKCGMDSYHSSLEINDCFVQDALNVYFDKNAGSVKRGGYTTAFSSAAYSYSGQWSYTDSSANIWMVVRSSESIIATTGVGTSRFTVRIATISANDIVNCTTAIGSFYCADQTQGVYYWNGTSTTFVTGSPHGNLIASFHNRVWVAGLAVPNGNFLLGSKYLDGNTWTTGVNSTDPVALQISLLDNSDVITALFPGFNDVLYVFRNYSTHGILGFDSTNFQISALNAEVGCIDQRGIQAIFGGLVFPSARGIEFFDGYTATRISDPIKNLVDPITLNSSFSQNSWVNQTLNDWASGTFSTNNNISTTTVSPAMQWRGAGKDTIKSDFYAGTLNGLSWNSPGLQLSTNTANITNNSFENGSSSWSFLSGMSPTAQNYSGVHCLNTPPKNGSYLIEYANILLGGTQPANVDFKAIKCSDSSVLGSTTVSTAYAGSCAWIQATIPLIESQARTCASITVQDTTNSRTLMTSDPFILNGSSMTFWYISDTAGGAGGPDLSIDFYENGRSSHENGTQISRVFDTGKTSSTVVPHIAWTINGSTPSFILQSSVDSSSWLDVTTSTGISKSVNRYVRYLSTWTFVQTLDFKSSWQSVDIQPFIFTSTWTSACHNVGSITSYGNLAVVQDLTGGASTAFTFCSSPNSNCSSASCAVIPANSQITVATNTYALVIATFTATVTTHTATVNSITASWYSGTRKPPMASMVYDNRYWLSITTNTADSTNDATLVLSKGPIWTLFDIKAGAFVIWKNAPYFADANPTGNTYQLEQGLNDNGSPINAYIKTKDYAPQGIIIDKYWDSIYLIADNAGAYNIDSTYYVDRSTTAYTLGTVAQNETPGTLISRLNIPIDNSHQNYSKTISFKFSNNESNAPFRFYGGSLRFHVRQPL